MKAIVETFNEAYGFDGDLGYTHSVLSLDEQDDTDVLEIVDFKNEFAARTYADAINMGLAV